MTKRKMIGILAVVAIIACTAYAGKGKCRRKYKCKKELPAEVKAAVEALYPAGEITKVKKEKKGVKVCEIEVDVNGIEVEVMVDCSGAVIEVETEQDINSLPAKVAKAVTSKGGEVLGAEKEVVYAEVKLVRLKSPMTVYEVKVKKDGEIMKLKIGDNGKIVEERSAKCGKGCSKSCCKKGQKVCGRKEQKSCSKAVKESCGKESQITCSKGESKD